MIVKRIEPMSLAKVMAMIYGGLGLIFGALFSLFAMVGSGLAAAAAEGDRFRRISAWSSGSAR